MNNISCFQSHWRDTYWFVIKLAAITLFISFPSILLGQSEDAGLAIVLPRANPGEMISGSLVTDAESYLGVPGLQVTKIPVSKKAITGIDVGDGHFRDSDIPFTLVLPTEGAVIKFTIRDGSLPRVVEIPVPDSFPLVSDNNARMPPFCVTGGVSVIHAGLSGDASETLVVVGAEHAQIIAERAGAVYWRVPHLSPGKFDVRLSQGSIHHRFSIYVGDITIDIPSRVSLSEAFSVTVHADPAGPYDRWLLDPPPDLVSLDSLVKNYSSVKHLITEGQPQALLLVNNLSTGMARIVDSDNDVVALPVNFSGKAFKYQGRLRSYSFHEENIRIVARLFPLFAERSELSDQPKGQPQSAISTSPFPEPPLKPAPPPREHYYPSWEETGDSIVHWEAATGISVTPEAFRQIQGQFWSQLQPISDALEHQHADAEGKTRLYKWLVESYLYELRDRMGSVQKDTTNRLTIPTYNGFLSGSREEPSKSVDAAVVSSFTALRYLQSLLPLFQAQVGRLFVTSMPEGASIVIDGEEKGTTCKKFVASVGSHSIKVSNSTPRLACSGSISIRSNDIEHFSCPGNSDCPAGSKKTDVSP